MHHVTTGDGYILELHRIPHRRNDGPNRRPFKPPVLIVHGLLDSSATWVLSNPQNALAYALVDAGYDVWLGNCRGNTYSRNHTHLNPDGRRRERQRFWSFSWHEIALHDLPAMIDYVLDQTRWKQLHYIGHSQGTTAFFILCSERPEYNRKILLMNALAPVAFMSNLRSPIMRAVGVF